MIAGAIPALAVWRMDLCKNSKEGQQDLCRLPSEGLCRVYKWIRGKTAGEMKGLYIFLILAALSSDGADRV